MRCRIINLLSIWNPRPQDLGISSCIGMDIKASYLTHKIFSYEIKDLLRQTFELIKELIKELFDISITFILTAIYLKNFIYFFMFYKHFSNHIRLPVFIIIIIIIIIIVIVIVNLYNVDNKNIQIMYSVKK